MTVQPQLNDHPTTLCPPTYFSTGIQQLSNAYTTVSCKQKQQGLTGSGLEKHEDRCEGSHERRTPEQGFIYIYTALERERSILSPRHYRIGAVAIAHEISPAGATCS